MFARVISYIETGIRIVCSALLKNRDESPKEAFMSCSRVLLRVFCLLCVFCCLFSMLSSCSRKEKTPHEMLLALLKEQKALPAGRVYLRSAEQGDHHLSNALLAQAFGNGVLPPAVDEIVDAAYYFSYLYPCEAGVFLCKSASSAHAVAKLCLQRIDFLRNHRVYDDLDDDTVSAYLGNASVSICGRFVILRIGA